MLDLRGCRACARYVRGEERECPFCGAVLEARSVTWRPAGRRTSRGDWLARGSALALMGCTSGVTAPQSTADATAVEASSVVPDANPAESSTEPETSADDGSVAPEAAASDVASEAQRPADAASGDATVATPTVFTCPDAGAFALTLGQGPFECAGAGTDHAIYGDAGDLLDTGVVDAALFCNRTTQYCVDRGNVWQCAPLGDLCVSPVGLYAQSLLGGMCDSGLVRCACGTWNTGGGCSDDDAGGLTNYAPCYGAPPALRIGEVNA
jgi:hypothetical protein